jgi:hypothetical protein
MTARESIENAMRIGLEKLRADIIQASEDAGQRATGRTYSRITTDEAWEGETLTGEVTGPDYFHTLLVGRGPGKVPAGFVTIIEDWARAKGIVFQSAQDARRFAYATARKIREEGTRMFRNAQYIDLVDEPAKTFETWLSQQLDDLMDNMISEIMVPTGKQGEYKHERR